MGGVAKNGAGSELLHPWGIEMDYKEESVERVGWEMVLPLTGGSHAGIRVHRKGTSINRRHITVAQYIATRPLLELCEGATQRGGARVKMRWWDQQVIDWEKAKARRVETAS